MNVREKIQAMSKTSFGVLLAAVVLALIASPYSIAIWSRIWAKTGYPFGAVVILGVQCILFVALVAVAWTAIKCRWY